MRCTRLTDFLGSLEKRAQFANRHANAIFVSVHFNKSNRGEATGLETCLAPRGVPSMDEENLSYSDYVQHPGHANDPANVALATTVHAALVRNLGLTDRGVKRARFVVIKNVTIPGILIEGGFMSGRRMPDLSPPRIPAAHRAMHPGRREPVQRSRCQSGAKTVRGGCRDRSRPACRT